MISRVALAVLIAGYSILPDIHAQPVGSNDKAFPKAGSVPALTDGLGDPLPQGAIARLGTLRFKHTPAGDPTIDVAMFSPDGTKIVSLVYGAASIRLWNAADGKEIRGPWTSPSRFTAVAFSPDSALLAAAVEANRGPGGKDKTMGREVVLYDIAAAKPVKTIAGLSNSVRALAFADGAKTLVCAGEGNVSWWDVATAKEQRSWKPFGDETQPAKDGDKKTKIFFNCAIGPDAKFIAVHVAWRYDKEGPNGAQRNEPIDQEAYGFSLATRKIHWRAGGGKRTPNERGRFAFSADGKRVAIAMGPDKVEVRDAVTGRLVADPLDAKALASNWLGGLTLSSDGAMAALAGGDSNVILWNIADAAKPRKFVARIAQFWPNSTQCLDFSPDQRTLLVGVDADLQLYDVATLQEVRASAGHRGWIDYLAFAADGKRLLSGCADINLHSQELASWDAATWKRLQLTSVRTPPWPNLGVVSPDQSVFVGKAGADRLAVFDLLSGKLRARFTVPDKQPGQGRGFFSPGGKLYLQEGQDDTGKPIERLYTVPSGKLLAQLPPLIMAQQSMESARPIAFSTDEQLIAFYGRDDGAIHVWDTATGSLRHRLGTGLVQEGGGKQGGFAANLAFARDGKLLASWSIREALIRVWDMATGKELLQVVPNESSPKTPGGPGNQQRVHFAWSPDSRMLAVGQSKIRVWELATLGVRREFAGHPDGPVRALAYSPSGRVLASGSADTTVLIWDMGMSASPAVAGTAWERGELSKRWQALAEDDAVAAFAAIGELAATPGASVPWIKEHLKPVGEIDAKRVEKLIGQLDDGQFKVRQKASAELLLLGERIVPAIDRVLAGNPVLETYLRLQDLRKRMTGLVLKGDRLQTLRAVEVLERIGTPEARHVLQALAGGADGALATTQARGALARWEK